MQCPQHEYSNRKPPLKSPSTHGTQGWAAGTGGAHEFFEQCLIIDSSFGGLLFRVHWCTAGLTAQPGQSCCPSLAQGLTQTRPQESHGARFCHPPLSKAISPSGKVRLPSVAKFLLTLSGQEWSKTALTTVQICEQELLELFADL